MATKTIYVFDDLVSVCTAENVKDWYLEETAENGLIYSNDEEFVLNKIHGGVVIPVDIKTATSRNISEFYYNDDTNTIQTIMQVYENYLLIREHGYTFAEYLDSFGDDSNIFNLYAVIDEIRF